MLHKIFTSVASLFREHRLAFNRGGPENNIRAQLEASFSSPKDKADAKLNNLAHPANRLHALEERLSERSRPRLSYAEMLHGKNNLQGEGIFNHATNHMLAGGDITVSKNGRVIYLRGPNSGKPAGLDADGRMTIVSASRRPNRFAPNPVMSDSGGIELARFYPNRAADRRANPLALAQLAQAGGPMAALRNLLTALLGWSGMRRLLSGNSNPIQNPPPVTGSVPSYLSQAPGVPSGVQFDAQPQGAPQRPAPGSVDDYLRYERTTPALASINVNQPTSAVIIKLPIERGGTQVWFDQNTQRWNPPNGLTTLAQAGVLVTPYQYGDRTLFKIDFHESGEFQVGTKDRMERYNYQWQNVNVVQRLVAAERQPQFESPANQTSAPNSLKSKRPPETPMSGLTLEIVNSAPELVLGFKEGQLDEVLKLCNEMGLKVLHVHGSDRGNRVVCEKTRSITADMFSTLDNSRSILKYVDAQTAANPR